MYQLFNIFALVEVFTDQLRRKPLIEDQAVIVLIEAIHVDAHEAEELWINQLFAAEDANLLREDLLKVHSTLFGLFVEREEHFGCQVE